MRPESREAGTGSLEYYRKQSFILKEVCVFTSLSINSSVHSPVNASVCQSVFPCMCSSVHPLTSPQMPILPTVNLSMPHYLSVLPSSTYLPTCSPRNTFSQPSVTLPATSHGLSKPQFYHLKRTSLETVTHPKGLLTKQVRAEHGQCFMNWKVLERN